MADSTYWIKKLNLSPHPEGGFFRECYRSDETIPREALPHRYSDRRVFFTSIYYLLESHQISRLHRLKSDELWHFYTGSPLTIHVFKNDGNLYNSFILGPDPGNKHIYQQIIHRGNWFGASVNESDSFTLVGCVVAPGFEFDDFEKGNRDELLSKYPDYADIIERLT